MKKTFHRIKKEIGIKVLEKYNWKCSVCSSVKDLCIHHIERMDINDKNYNNLDNLTVVCRSCHMSLHRKAGHIVPYKNGEGNIFGRRGKGNPPVKCKIEGCDNMQHGRALCKKHYEFYRRRDWFGI